MSFRYVTHDTYTWHDPCCYQPSWSPKCLQPIGYCNTWWGSLVLSVPPLCQFRCDDIHGIVNNATCLNMLYMYVYVYSACMCICASIYTSTHVYSILCQLIYAFYLFIQLDTSPRLKIVSSRHARVVKTMLVSGMMNSVHCYIVASVFLWKAYLVSALSSPSYFFFATCMCTSPKRGGWCGYQVPVP